MSDDVEWEKYRSTAKIPDSYNENDPDWLNTAQTEKELLDYILLRKTL